MGCWTVIKSFHVKIILLDKQELIQEIQGKTTGQDLLNNIYKYLNLIETAYFGLRYQDNSNQTHWLDPSKRVYQQIKGVSPITLYLGVKFYAADPCKLVEEITRYQFFLQVKLDILQGRLPVPSELATDLAALSLQSELGDFDSSRHSPGYASEFRFLASQTEEQERKVEGAHGKMVGLLPSQAENRYLEKVKWLDMYGVDLHPVIGEDNIEYYLGLTPSGIIVLRNRNKVGNYFWPRISKIYFKAKYFMLRVRDKNNEESTYGFETPSRQACKHLWKCCVEHHAFFRLVQVNPTAASSNMFGLGSKFRYSGRTEKEVSQEVTDVRRPPPPFTRVPSERFSRRSRSEEPAVMGERQRGLGGGTLERKENGSSHGNLVSKHLSNNNLYEPSPRGSSLPRHSSMMGLQSLPVNLQDGEGVADMSLQSLQYLESRGLFGSRAGGGRKGSELDTSQAYQADSSTPGHTKKRISRRGGSDEESEISGVSLASGRHHKGRQDRGAESGSESESSRVARKNHRGRRKRSGSYKLVETDEQWREVQRQQGRRGQGGVSEATVRKSGYINSGAETESELITTLRRNKRRQRSRSRSPSEARSKLPSELVKHFEFDLQEPPEDQAQLKEIPYTNVETQKPIKVRYGSNSRRSRHSSGNSARRRLNIESSRDSEVGDLTENSRSYIEAPGVHVPKEIQEDSSKGSHSQSSQSHEEENSWSNSSRGSVQQLSHQISTAHIQSPVRHQGYREDTGLPGTVPPPNISKPSPPLPPKESHTHWSQNSPSINVNHNNYINHVSHSNSGEHQNQNMLTTNMNHSKIINNNPIHNSYSSYKGPPSSLPGHLSNHSYHSHSPIMGYKAVNPPIGTILNHSAMGLHNGSPQRNHSSLVSSSSNNSSSSSPRQMPPSIPDTSSNPNLAFSGLPSTGLTSLPAYAPVYNGEPSHSSAPNQYIGKDNQETPPSSRHMSITQTPGIRQAASRGSNSPSRHPHHGPPPPIPSMAGRLQLAPHPQTPPSRLHNCPPPPPMPVRSSNPHNPVNMHPGRHEQYSKNWSPAAQQMNKNGGLNGGSKRPGHPYEPSGDEMSTEL